MAVALAAGAPFAAAQGETVRAGRTPIGKGQVTRRQELLRHLGMQPGQQIEVSTLPGGRIEVRAAQPAGSIEAFIGRLAGRSAKVASLEEIQASARAGWAGEP